MIVCVCHRVSDRDIERIARSGCPSFEELQFESRVGTCCGRCESCARQVYERAATHPGCQAADALMLEAA